MKNLYNIFVSLLIFGIKLGAVFSYKLKRGLAGRRVACETVKKTIFPEDKVIWMHAASLGEYEQGLPVLERLKKHYPQHKILITFFSPSGYENVVKRKHIADAVCYLPFDKMKWVREFSSNFRTEIFFTVKYDYWYHLLEELKSQGARIYVVSALFYETQLFFRAYGGWFVNELKENVDWFFHQNRHSTALAKSIGLQKSSTSGDTRYDRVKNQLQCDNQVPFMKDFADGKTTVVFGSSWQAEEHIAEILSSKTPDVKLIIAPHDLKRVDHLKKIFPTAVLYSQLSKSQISNLKSQILIVDCIGLLSKIYSYADLAVVGGGFHSKGLHNILEAAVFGVPVFFGDQYKNKPEADALIAADGAKAFEDEFFAANYLLNLLKHPERMDEMGRNARNFIEAQPDATGIILKKLIS